MLEFLGFDEGTGFGVDTFSAIPASIPLQNKNPEYTAVKNKVSSILKGGVTEAKKMYSKTDI